MDGYGELRFWLSLLESLELVQFLDFTTTFCHVVSLNTSRDEGPEFIGFVQRAFNEENVAYEVDNLGGIHYRIDAEFQANRAASMQALEGPENAAARASFEAAHEALRNHKSDTIMAVRLAFDAVENLFKRIHGTSRLGAGEVKSKLSAIGDASSVRAGDSARRFNASFAEWVNACHQYRHADGEPDPTPPPRWLAIALVDSASIYIRYLIVS